MSDIDIFDPKTFFDHRLRELEQDLISRQAKAEILKKNLANLDQTIKMLETLPEGQQKALQMELTALHEARVHTERHLETLGFELDNLGAKLRAIQAARSLLNDPTAKAPTDPSTAPAAVTTRRPANRRPHHGGGDSAGPDA